MTTPIVDFHNHPTLKPYGHSYYDNEDRNDKISSACIWHPDPPTPKDELAENAVGFSPYRECDFTSAIQGRVSVAVVSMYPVEKGFVNPTIFKKGSDGLIDLISCFGRKRIDYLQSNAYNYFEDLKAEYGFLMSLHDKPPVNGVSKYKVMGSGTELVTTPSNILKVILSIEGAHVFCNGNDVNNHANWVDVEKRIAEVKAWANAPFFVTLCHHFYNGLASHAQSLFISLFKKDLLNQREGMSKPVENGKYITTLGYTVIDKLYNNAGEKRILIDVKHMAKETRKEFYDYRKGRYDDIPVICSHGALTTYYSQPINLDKDDVREIFNSNGIFGIELDQRVLGYNESEQKSRFKNWFKNIFHSPTRNEYFWAEYFWKNIIAVAEICYDLNPNDNPWRILALGSDFDGVINPINKYRTSASLQPLAENLLKYLTDYWKTSGCKIPPNHKGMDAHTVVYNIMYLNAYDFIVKHYKGNAAIA